MSFLPNLFLILSVLLIGLNFDPIVRQEPDAVYDFIVVGSGPGGATVASRLSEIPDVKILLLEAGESDLNNPQIQIPTRAYELDQTDIDWKYETEAISQPPFSDRSFQMPRGKTLGGTSSINYNVYMRGSPHDFDSWEDSGAAGWGWNNVEPYFRKVENATMDEMSANLGRNGNLKLSRNHNKPSVAWTFIKNAASELGIKTTDYNDDMLGISPVTFTIHEGIRQNSVTAYIRPIHKERQNRLHIVTGALVSKVLIDNDSQFGPKAYGVEYLKNGKYHTVRARKEVIISAGAIGTPQILLLSGIGPKNDLRDLEIPVIKDLPGVGLNLENHLSINANFMTNLTNPPPEMEPVVQYILNGNGPMSMFPYSAVFVKLPLNGTSTSLNERRRLFPDILLFVQESPALPTLLYLAMLLHPKSKGKITLRSKDIQDYPVINPNYLEHGDDLQVLKEAYRLMEKFEMTAAFQKAGARVMMPSICNVTENKYAPRSDRFYNCLIWETSGSEHHQCCTAKMGSSSDEYAVVDSKLRVIGVKGLRVVDASVFPHQTSSNTQASVYMVAEKAADLIKQTWQLRTL
uniref:glucose dehydrogenase [FAD, quinone]-like isoform X1 n=1 Tax=Styela clava TaxID=7725 RepID=UPI00193A52E3|nr:glucose dehydrogenase [FAD, quinone]-like isoform X1 [Styela clava]